MQWSMGWFMGPIVLLVIRDQFRKANDRRREIAKAAALTNEEDAVLARLDDLPAWVKLIFLKIFVKYKKNLLNLMHLTN